MENGGEKSKIKEVKFEKSVSFAAESIIENALNLHATDVHIEPQEDFILVRFRINGVLKNINIFFERYVTKNCKIF